MALVLLDTHSWVWSFAADPKLSPAAAKAINLAETVAVSAVTVYEISQKVRIGKWPSMAIHVDELPHLIRNQGAVFLPVTPEIALLAGQLDWSHRDPFDRMLAATALAANLDFVSADAAFDELKGLRRIW